MLLGSLWVPLRGHGCYCLSFVFPLPRPQVLVSTTLRSKQHRFCVLSEWPAGAPLCERECRRLALQSWPHVWTCCSLRFGDGAHLCARLGLRCGMQQLIECVIRRSARVFSARRGHRECGQQLGRRRLSHHAAAAPGSHTVPGPATRVQRNAAAWRSRSPGERVFSEGGRLSAVAVHGTSAVVEMSARGRLAGAPPVELAESAARAILTRAHAPLLCGPPPLCQPPLEPRDVWESRAALGTQRPTPRPPARRRAGRGPRAARFPAGVLSARPDGGPWRRRRAAPQVEPPAHAGPPCRL